MIVVQFQLAQHNWKTRLQTTAEALEIGIQDTDLMLKILQFDGVVVLHSMVTHTLEKKYEIQLQEQMKLNQVYKQN